MYALEQAPHEDAILSRAMRSKRPIPSAIANAPELIMGLELFYDGFRVLHTSRGEGAIPWTAMLAYCREYGLDHEQRQIFYELVGEMDAAYLDYRAKKAKAERDTKRDPKQ